MGNELQVMRFNIAICDDEKAICEQINELIKKEKEGICTDLYKTGDSLLAATRSLTLYFLIYRWREQAELKR